MNALRKLQKMQKDMMSPKELEETIFTGSAGGVVSVEAKGDKTLVSVKTNLKQSIQKMWISYKT